MTLETAAPTDLALILRARSGDRAAFGELVRRHQNGVYGVALRFLGDPEEARDLAQEVFITVFQRLGQFRGDAKFSTWIYVIVRHAAQARLAKRGRELAWLDAAEGDDRPLLARLADERADPAQALLQRDTHEGVQAAMMELPERYRLVIGLHHFQDMGYAEMATVLGVPLGTIKTHLYRAKAHLKTILDARGLR